MICYKIKEGVNFCNPDNAKRWIQRVVLFNRGDVGNDTIIRNRYTIFFKTNNKISEEIGDTSLIGGYAFEYPDVYAQILGNAESVEDMNYRQWRHNVQVSLAGFEHFKKLDELNRGEIFAALLDSNDNIWIFGFDYGLKPAVDYLYQNIEMDTITLQSRVLEDTPPLLYLGDTSDFWNNFTEVEDIPKKGDFNNDFNDDFFNV